MKPRICLVVSSPMTLRTLIAPHVAALQERYAVTAVANLGAGEPRPVGPGADFVSLPIERRIAPLRDLTVLVRLAWVFRRSRFAAVQSVTPKAGLLAMLAGVLARVPVRVHIFTGQVWATRRGPTRWFLRQMDRVIAACATHVLVDSPSQREFLVDEGVVTAGRSRVLGKGSIAGVDAARFRPDPDARNRVRAQLGCRDNDDVVFLYLGRLNRDKGVLDLAAAFSRIAGTAPGPRLLVVGPDEDGMQPAMRAALGDAAARATFVGYTDQPERYMAAADVFCLPSYREGFGTSIIEAGASCVPAVGSRIYGVTDAIEDNVTGLLFEPGDIEALSRCMDRLARDPALRAAMGRDARARALRDFQPEAVTGDLLDIYRAAIG